MVTPDAYVEAVVAASRKPALKPEVGRRGLRGLRDPQAPRRAGRLRRPARPRRPRPRGGRHVRGGAALAVPTPLRGRAAGREPAPVPPPGGVARRPLRRHRRGRSATGDLRLERRRRRVPPRHPPLVATGRGDRARPELPVDARDPRRRRRRAAQRPATGPRGAGHAGRRPAAPPRRPRRRPRRGDRHRPGRPAGARAGATLVGAGRAGADPRPDAPASRRRSAGAGIPHRVRGGAAFLDRPDVRRALRDLRSATVPLGTALADLELQLDAQATRRGRAARPPRRRRRRPRQWCSTGRPTSGPPSAALLRMGRDYLRLDPVGRADTFSSWLTATVQSEGDHPGSRDAVDVATFHAAKGLEWTTVHLAGVEDGYVPIAHARTAAARAEEARLLYVAMTRAQRELRITWAEHRTFGGKVVERRRSPLLDPLVQRAAARPAPAEPGPITPPVDDWSDEVARQREVLRAGRRAAATRAGGAPSLAGRRGACRPHRPGGRAARPRAQPGRRRRGPATSRSSARCGAWDPILASRFGDAMLGALSARQPRREATDEVQHRAAVRRRRRRGRPRLRRSRRCTSR